MYIIHQFDKEVHNYIDIFSNDCNDEKLSELIYMKHTVVLVKLQYNDL